MILVLKAYVTPLNSHYDVLGGTKGRILDPNLPLHPYFLYMISYGSGKTGLLLLTDVMYQCDVMYQNLVCWQN